jgi:hypothetical protein
MIKEAVTIWLHPRNFNRDRGFTLSWSWYSVSNMLEQQRSTHPEKRPNKTSTQLHPPAPHWFMLSQIQALERYINGMVQTQSHHIPDDGGRDGP